MESAGEVLLIVIVTYMIGLVQSQSLGHFAQSFRVAAVPDE